MGKSVRDRLERAIRATEKRLDRFRSAEAKSRARWTKGYQRFVKAAADLSNLKNVATQKAQRLRDVIQKWPERTVELTIDRDDHRDAIAEAEQKLRDQRTELAVLLERLHNETQRVDDVVDQVFVLNDGVISALHQRNEFLTAHVYNQLFNEDGSLRSQVTLTSSDGLRRVVALVNHITRVDVALAAEAKVEVQKFFDRFQEAVEKDTLDDTVRALMDILENILIERVSFRVGPDLYRFISIPIDGDVFPELARAQNLLRHSLRSEKTNSYIRLYRRSEPKGKWTEVKLS